MKKTRGGALLLDPVLRDLRYAARSLRRDLGATVFAIAIAGLGIGASTTVFGLCQALLLRPLPFREPEQLVWIANGTSENLSAQTVQVSTFQTLVERNRSFDGVAGLEQLVDRSVFARRFVVMLVAGFAVFGVVLSALGIYALISYSVSQRTQEIGIRMALGATADGVRRAILAETGRLAVLGLTLGLPLSWMAARAIRALLYDVGSFDTATFGATLLVLVAVAACGGYPRHAARHRSIPPTRSGHVRLLDDAAAFAR